MPTDNKPLTDPLLFHISDIIWLHLMHILNQSLSCDMQNRVVLDRAIAALDCIMPFTMSESLSILLLLFVFLFHTAIIWFLNICLTLANQSRGP